MTAFLLALPEVGAYNLGPPFGCMEEFPTVELRKAYSLLLFLACYLLPLLFIVPAYTRMILRLWRDREDFPGSGVSEDPKNRKRKRNVLKMMAIVVICYAVCMLPTYAMFLWLDFGLKSTEAPPTYFFTLLSFTQVINFFNSCVNPVIYWFLSEQFSKGFKRILRCNKLNSWTRQHSSTSSSEPNVHTTVNPNTVPTRV